MKRHDFDIIEDEIQRMYSAPSLKGREGVILDKLKRDRIRYVFYDEYSGEYGEAERLIRALSKQFNVSVSFVKNKCVYPKPTPED